MVPSSCLSLECNMAYDRFLIAPLNTGLENDLRPWLIPDDAFESFNNVYIFRGRVRKRFGGITTGTSSLTSRLRILIDTTNGGTGNAAGTVPGYKWALGQMFSIGAALYTVSNPAGGVQAMFQTVVTPTATFNITTGAYNFVGAPLGMPVYYYPATSVMGFGLYETGPINNHPTIAFDTQFAYRFAGGAWNRSASAPDPQPVWHGTDSQFFWGANWQSLASSGVSFFVTNFRTTPVPVAQYPPAAPVYSGDDPIWSYDGADWQPFSYSPDANLNPTNTQPFTVTRATAVTGAIVLNYVQSARIIIVFKNRLLLLNTIENNANGADAFNTGTPTTTGITPARYLTSTNTAYPWRVRYSQYGGPFARNAWLEENQVFKPDTGAALLNYAGGGYVDAATEEAIISAEFIKDRLIVYFERSTWELAYTGNEIQPFSWYKINTELGSESTFSIVPFDKITLAVGEQGIHACNGANVNRVDQKIPNTIFTIRTANNGVSRVAGIRDYYTEQVYWTFPTSSVTTGVNDVYPNKILVYNYITGSWAFFEDCITAFGYFEQEDGITWVSSTTNWEDSNFSWSSGIIQANPRQILAGNQQGFVFIVSPDVGRNAPVMQITNVVVGFPFTTITIINHTLSTNDWIVLENLQGITDLNGLSFQIVSVVDNNTIICACFLNAPGTYTGGGTATRLSQIIIKSKQWNPYVKDGRNVFLSKIDFAVQRTSMGAITVDYYPSSSNLSLVSAANSNSSNLGTNVLETSPYALVPLEQKQTRLWHSIYFQAEGECIQISINSQDQMLNPNIMWEDFQIEGMILHTKATSSRLQ